MDVTTCEQYVIARLDEAEAEIARLDAEKAEAEERIADLEREAGKVRGTTEASIVAGMRRAFFDKVALTYMAEATDGQGAPVPFGEWASEVVKTYMLPKGVTADDFMAFFHRELREAYEDALGEVSR